MLQVLKTINTKRKKCITRKPVSNPHTVIILVIHSLQFMSIINCGHTLIWTV